MKRVLAASVALAISGAAFSEENIQKFSDNLDGGKDTCKSFSGTEIKKIQTYDSGKDRYYNNFNVSMISGNGPKEASCKILGSTTKKIKVSTAKGFDVEVDVPATYTV